MIWIIKYFAINQYKDSQVFSSYSKKKHLIVKDFFSQHEINPFSVYENKLNEI